MGTLLTLEKIYQMRRRDNLNKYCNNYISNKYILIQSDCYYNNYYNDFEQEFFQYYEKEDDCLSWSNYVKVIINLFTLETP